MGKTLHVHVLLEIANCQILISQLLEAQTVMYTAHVLPQVLCTLLAEFPVLPLPVSQGPPSPNLHYFHQRDNVEQSFLS